MKNKLILFFKGIAMGAADVVPGVSGGTIAFISGIYEELLSSIKSVDLEALKLLTSFKFKAFWQKINGNFLIVLFAGIAFSILSLSRLVLYLLENQPILLWSFFFGLIVASVFLVAKQISKWSALPVLALVIGTAIAYYISSIGSVADENASLLYVFICGAVAICAMILPGISGSFILILMGAYQLIFGTIKELLDSLVASNFAAFFNHLKLILVFIVGCLFGLISFSRLLSWLFKNYHNTTVALLIGFLIGSLNKVWPWKETIDYYVDRHGVSKPLLQENVLPTTFSEINNQPSQIVWALLLAIVGFFCVYSLELFSKKKEETINT